jgi:hypothetical protein
MCGGGGRVRGRQSDNQTIKQSNNQTIRRDVLRTTTLRHGSRTVIGGGGLGARMGLTQIGAGVT